MPQHPLAKEGVALMVAGLEGSGNSKGSYQVHSQLTLLSH